MKPNQKPVDITLAEFNAFAKQLSDDWYFEGDECFIDEAFWDGKFDPSEVITVGPDEITLCWQGDTSESQDESYIDFLPEYLKWKRGYGYEFVVLQVPEGMKAEIESLVKEHLKRKGIVRGKNDN
jgi:hypothetical protein